MVLLPELILDETLGFYVVRRLAGPMPMVQHATTPKSAHCLDRPLRGILTRSRRPRRMAGVSSVSRPWRDALEWVSNADSGHCTLALTPRVEAAG